MQLSNMIEKNSRGNIIKISLDNIDTEKFSMETQINKILKRQDEIESVLNSILKEIQNGIKRINKY
jgi:hypothetical protein